MKIYKSKLGLKFCIANFSVPTKKDPHTLEDVVTFTTKEWDQIKEMNLKPDEFKLLWLMKQNDYKHVLFPENESEPKKLAEKYGSEIVNMLRGKNENRS
jgi:hypothetical protein